MVENEAIVPRNLCKIGPGYEAIMRLLQVIKAGSGRSRNEAVKVGTLTLFQDRVKLLSWSDYTASLVHTKTLFLSLLLYSTLQWLYEWLYESCAL